MNDINYTAIFNEFAVDGEALSFTPCKIGLINTTYFVKTDFFYLYLPTDSSSSILSYTSAGIGHSSEVEMRPDLRAFLKQARLLQM